MMRRLIILCGIALLLCANGNAQQKLVPLDTVRTFATKALANFSKLVTKDNYKLLGFDTPGAVESAQLGAPIQVYMVRLDHLKEYGPDDDPIKLLTGGEQIIYPVKVEDQVQSSIVVEKVKDNWEATSYGDSYLAKLLAKTRKMDSDSSKLAISSYFAVRVPALNLYFIAHRADDMLMLTPLIDEPDYGFKAGVSMPAGRAFEAILPAAKEHDGLPR